MEASLQIRDWRLLLDAYAPRLHPYPSALGEKLRDRQDALSALRSIMDRRGALRFKKPCDADVFGRNRVVLDFPNSKRALDVHRSFFGLVGKERGRSAPERVRRSVKRCWVRVARRTGSVGTR